jgi:hypothetical protein
MTITTERHIVTSLVLSSQPPFEEWKSFLDTHVPNPLKTSRTFMRRVRLAKRAASASISSPIRRWKLHSLSRVRG